MKYIRQFLIILSISFIGEFLNSKLPLPIPASIYGIIIMLIALKSGILKTSQVKEVSDFLIEILPLMFIAPAAQILPNLDIIKPIILPLGIICIATTILVMVISGLVTQWVIRLKQK